jgi:transcription elongation factor GreA
MTNEVEFLTQEKKEELEKELEYRKGEKRQEILDRLAFAKSLGDLSENAEYHTSKDDQGKNEARIAQIEAILKDAVVVEANNDGTVGLGSRVTILHKEKEIEKTYQIVGKEEADFSAGKISFDSPIGSALLDKKEGDMVDVETPKGVTQYKIIKVS